MIVVGVVSFLGQIVDGDFAQVLEDWFPIRTSLCSLQIANVIPIHATEDDQIIRLCVAIAVHDGPRGAARIADAVFGPFTNQQGLSPLIRQQMLWPGKLFAVFFRISFARKHGQTVLGAGMW